MSEEPKKERIIRRQINENDKQTITSKKDLDALSRYIQNRLATVIEHEPDGCLAEAMEFQSFRDDSIAFYEIDTIDPKEPLYQVEGFRKRHIISHIKLGVLEVGDEFRKVGDFIEDEIIGLPQDALAFLQKYGDNHGDGLPKRVKRIPADKTGTLLDTDTRYSRITTSYQLDDYRKHDLGHCIEHVRVVRDKMISLIENSKAEILTITVNPENRWNLLLHAYKWDYLGRMKALLEKEVDMPDVEMTDSIPRGYDYDSDDDFIATVGEVGEHTNDYPPYIFNELRSRLEMLREEYESILLYVRLLNPADGDPSDGTVVEMYKKPYEVQ